METRDSNREVQLSDGTTVQVKQLSWKDTNELYQRLKDQLKAMAGGSGNLVFDANKTLDAIGESAELVTWLVQRSTGKDEAWVQERSFSDVMEITAIVVETNLNIVAAAKSKAQGWRAGLLSTGLRRN